MYDELPFGEGWDPDEFDRKNAMRKQVRSEIIAFMIEAQKKGKHPFSAAQAAFPAVPAGILGQCLMEADNAEEEAWWEHMERTIEEEVVRNALQKAMKRGS
jgi:hypothetical protein